MAFNEKVNDLRSFYMTEIYDFSVQIWQSPYDDREVLRKRDFNQLAEHRPSIKVGPCQNFGLSSNRLTYIIQSTDRDLNLFFLPSSFSKDFHKVPFHTKLNTLLSIDLVLEARGFWGSLKNAILLHTLVSNLFHFLFNITFRLFINYFCHFCGEKTIIFLRIPDFNKQSKQVP